MRDYTVVFVEPVDLEVLARTAAEAFDIPRDRIELWNGQTFLTPVTDPPIAQIAGAPGPGAFAEFVAFETFAAHAGRPTHLEVAVKLATLTGKQVIFAPDSPEDYQWTRVDADGGHVKVLLDSDQLDEGAYEILGTPEPPEA